MLIQTQDSGPTRQPSAVAFGFVLITVVLDLLAMGITVPVLPDLVLRLLHGNTESAALAFGALTAVWALMQFLCSPLQGVLSDRFGRRPVILISNFGLSFDYILMAVAPNLSLLLVGRILSGMAAASISTAMAYIADVSPPDQRAGRFGLISIAFGLGFVLGPAVGGLLGNLSLRLPFWCAAGLSLANAAYGLIVLPESLSLSKRTAFAWRRANPIGSWDLLRSQAGLLGLAGASLLSFVARQVLPSIFVLYGGYRYGWSQRAIGLTLATIGVCSALVGGALVGTMVRRLGGRSTLLLGLICGAVGLTILGSASREILFWAGIPIVTLWGVCPPTFQSLMSRQVGPDVQGQLQGAGASLVGLAGLIGPGLFTMIFAWSIGFGGPNAAGTPFFVAAVLMLGALVVTERVTRRTLAARADSVE